MSEIFVTEDAQNVLHNRFIVIIGDSIQRSVYKDIVCLLQDNRFLSDRDLRSKGEPRFMSDECLVGSGSMHAGTNCREVRQYITDFHLIRYYYVTRCYNPYLESVLAELMVEPRPDVVIMNSCVWDITRYGDNSIPTYKENMKKLLRRVSETLGSSSLFVWTSCLPISKSAKGGFIAPELKVMHDQLRLDIMAANIYIQKLVRERGFDFLDVHYYLRHHIHRRAEDGIHWDMTAHRRMTNLLLSHVSQSWKLDIPRRAEHIFDAACDEAERDLVRYTDGSEEPPSAPPRVIKKAKRRVQIIKTPSSHMPVARTATNPSCAGDVNENWTEDLGFENSPCFTNFASNSDRARMAAGSSKPRSLFSNARQAHWHEPHAFHENNNALFNIGTLAMANALLSEYCYR